jgi:hypothetical protein
VLPVLTRTARRKAAKKRGRRFGLPFPLARQRQATRFPVARLSNSRTSRRLFTGWLVTIAYVFALPGVSLTATTLAVDVIGPHIVESGWRGDALVFVLHHGEPATLHSEQADAGAERARISDPGGATHEHDHELVVPTNADPTSNREVGKARKSGEPPRGGACFLGATLKLEDAPRPFLTSVFAVNARAGPLACVRTTVLRI